MNTNKSTKEKILDASLDLFSQRGYEGVSVKQIADAVGIKDSSLYKHYKSKQEIFDTLLDAMNDKFEETVISNQIPEGEARENAIMYGENDLEWLKNVVKIVFNFFYSDPYASKFRKLLMIEQYNNNKAAVTFREFFINAPLKFQEDLFREMSELGYMKAANPRVMALEFYGPLFMLLMEYDNLPEESHKAMEILMEHVEQFSTMYSADNE